MFNSTILDVAIGMIFVYLLLSLICSAANELIEAKLKNRSKDLENGIRNLLGDKGLADKIYSHDLVSGLFSDKKGKPSYIPAQTFALALMNTVFPNGTAEAVGAGNKLEELRTTVANLPESDAAAPIKKALLAFIDDAQGDVNKLRKDIEDWYDAAMDRVSGWYKRRAQVFILIIALFVAVGLNADSIAIGKRLWSDKPLRESLVAAADAYARANASPAASPTPKTGSETNTSGGAGAKAKPTTTPTPTPTPATTPKPTPAATPNGTPTPCWQQACQGNEGSDDCVRKKAECALVNCSTEECAQGKDSPQCKLKQTKCEIDRLGLPIGWTNEEWPGIKFWKYDNVWTNWAAQIRNHVWGWLLTALAISLGAPFWFDLLNKFIVVRSTVKPKEKSPEEKSKD